MTCRLLTLVFLLIAAPNAVAMQTSAAESAFEVWARTSAVPLYGPEGSIGPAVVAAIGDARVVGIGESVHNVADFLRLRRLLVQRLVEGATVGAVVLESGLPESLALDDYVRGVTDTVDFGAVLTYGMGAFVEVRETFRWLRRWNTGAGRDSPVRVFGVDLPGNAGSMLPALEPVLSFLDGVDTVASRRFRTWLRPIAARVVGGFWRPAVARYDSLSPESKASLRAGTGELVRLFERNRADYVMRAGADRYRLAARQAVVAAQTERMFRLGAYHQDNPRDQAMAANLRWVASEFATNRVTIVLAHNAHVQRVPIAGPALPGLGPVAPLGLILSRDLGPGYFAIGTAYGGPSLDSSSAPVPGSVDRALGGTGGAEPFVLDLRAVPATGRVREWLERPRPMRFQVGHLELAVGQAFDALVYFESVERAHADP